MRAAAFFLLSAGLPAWGAPAGGSWRDARSAHFLLRHESPLLPAGFLPALEGVRRRLKPQLEPLVPWLGSDRVRVYLYRNAASFRAGEFRPPPWSHGLSRPDLRLVAVYEQPEPGRLLQVVAHQLGHLALEGYWGVRVPPPWLNEGFAMLMEEAASEPGRGPWAREAAGLPLEGLLPLERLVHAAPREGPEENAETARWYLQSYLLAEYLYRQHPRPRFLALCRALRGGASFERALPRAYPYADPLRLERAWLAWLRRRNSAAPYEAAFGEFKLPPLRRP